MDSGFQILDSNQCGTWILDSLVGFRIPDTGVQSVWNLDSGFHAVDSGFQILDSNILSDVLVAFASLDLKFPNREFKQH